MSEIKFRHENWGDDWQEWNSDRFNGWREKDPWDHEDAAERFAEADYAEDPSSNYECVVEIMIDNVVKKFTVTAEPDIVFSASEHD